MQKLTYKTYLDLWQLKHTNYPEFLKHYSEIKRSLNQWIESEHPRDKDGKFADKEETDTISVNGDELGTYSDIKELRLKAIEYYKNNIAGQTETNPELGEVKFTTKGFKKPVSFSADIRKLKLFPFLKDIVKYGKIDNQSEDNKERKEVYWTVLKTKIKIEGVLETVRINVRKDERGNVYYDHVIDKALIGTAYNVSQSKSFNNMTIKQFNEILKEELENQDEYVLNIFIEDTNLDTIDFNF